MKKNPLKKIIKDGKAIMYSRNGKVLENFPHITEAINKTPEIIKATFLNLIN